jgi:hypothetical protein
MVDNNKRMALRLSRLEREVRSLGSTPQLRYSSVDGGTLDFNNEDGTPSIIVGEIGDGTSGFVVVGGPTPPVPTAPVVTPGGPLQLNVSWDGTYARESLVEATEPVVDPPIEDDPGTPEDESAGTGGTVTIIAPESAASSLFAPGDYSRTTIHSLEPDFDMADFDPIRTHLPVGYFPAVHGGSTTILSPVDTEVKIVLVTWSTAGKLSDPSEPTLGIADGSGISEDSPLWIQHLIEAQATQEAAEAAATEAAEAQTTATAANLAAAAAVQSAELATIAADTAQTDATNALLSAGAANTTADLAVASASTAASDASDALLAAGAAATDADAAQAAADGLNPVTGGVLQTSATASRGIKITSSGMTAYDATGTPTLTLSSTDGSATFKGAITSGSSITGASMDSSTITGGVFQTSATAARGIKMTTSGLTAYDNSGVATFSLTSAGAASFKGAINSGSTIDGVNITGSTITGGVFQTTATAARGIKITTSGLVAYDTNGQVMLNLDATNGSANFRGSIDSGSVISGAYVYGGYVTGSILQTTDTANRGIKISSSGLIGYSNTGVPTTSIDPNSGQLTVSGPVMSGGSVTGSLLQSSSGVTSGVKLDANGLRAYNGSGALTFQVSSSTGNVSATGGSFMGASFGTSGGRMLVSNESLKFYASDGVTETMRIQADGYIFSSTNVVADKSIHAYDLYSDNEAVGTVAGELYDGRMSAQGRFVRGPVANSTNSSRRYKHDIAPMSRDTARLVLELEPVTYRYNPPAFDPDHPDEYVADRVMPVVAGFIAEQAVEVGADLWVVRDVDGRPDSFRYEAVIPAHTLVLREQEDRIAYLESKIAGLLERVDAAGL